MNFFNILTYNTYEEALNILKHNLHKNAYFIYFYINTFWDDAEIDMMLLWMIAREMNANIATCKSCFYHHTVLYESAPNAFEVLR